MVRGWVRHRNTRLDTGDRRVAMIACAALPGPAPDAKAQARIACQAVPSLPARSCHDPNCRPPDRARGSAPFVRACHAGSLSCVWQLLTHADASFGDSEGTWLVRANFAYLLGQRRQDRLLFGYQYKQAEFRDGDLNLHFTYFGPMLGFDFRFNSYATENP
jgi:hypothetical protein